ncbi:hypothetical protein BXT84_00670 [Sulfobacillus thermotolerans]|uniref:DUF488 domain-containing protein n=1 Tax=Sulfobacillus thermotolerans TaxID=338644 RepID=A0ABN5GZ65_9FIRM|nr:hypothetical protein BXT84_00670 [Sulfobacillus thermotolerans]
MHCIYTIGYGKRTILEFMDALQPYHIDYLVDVRTKPTSRFNPDFTRERLDSFLSRYHIRYLWMGDTLGGLPSDNRCYVNGRVDYAKVEMLDSYQYGIGRLQTAWNKHIPLVVMCAEGKPEACHRSKLIGQTLSRLNIPVAHIDVNGDLVTQQEVIQRLTQGQLSWFESSLTSRKRYVKSGEPY